MKNRYILLCLSLFAWLWAGAQGSHSFKINEVVVNNVSGLEDEYGAHNAWIEIFNDSWGTNNIRSCYLTNNPKVLDKSLSVPERVSMMSPIIKGKAFTNLEAQQMVVFFLDGMPNRGAQHMGFTLNPDTTNFIALYDANGVDLLDSLTIPKLGADASWARVTEDGKVVWTALMGDKVTPGMTNDASGAPAQSKVAEFKERDPHGFAMSIMAMSIVFGCLFLLFIFFKMFGWVMKTIAVYSRRYAIHKVRVQLRKVVVVAKEGIESKGIDDATYMAVIAMALSEYEDNVHDVESNVLTIHEPDSDWTNKNVMD